MQSKGNDERIGRRRKRSRRIGMYCYNADYNLMYNNPIPFFPTQQCLKCQTKSR
jgi:hypothetical protein